MPFALRVSLKRLPFLFEDWATKWHFGAIAKDKSKPWRTIALTEERLCPWVSF
jgi:hypothetical protein